MKSLLSKTGSISILPEPPKISISRRDSFNGIFSGEKNTVSSPKISMHLEINRQRDTPIRRALSESDLMKSEAHVFSRSFPAIIPEEEHHDVDSRNFSHTGIWPNNGIPLEELGFNGGGFGKGKKFGGGKGGGDRHNREFSGEGFDVSKMSDYYKEMLKSNPSDSLLLRNYAKFLHEVEGDMERAEEYYGRAILESPGDGEVLAMYGKLIWDAQKDGERANAYFDQAVSASPDDCMVLGSYAHFMWEAENDEEEEISGEAELSSAMVAVF
ncbi:hypothetical protein JCGZ_13620 [Jatropha curcas]|uniref:TmcB/TmcC TPR repeats domain-containing protein n=1 Tax=Jatropha curcas TaxID=180498 RepID=A0A067KMJ7_JATCU|nr:hypothetical protein JCGZ_13620 [Jatropha curcas]